MSWSWCCSLLHALIYHSVLPLLSLQQSDPWELIWVGHWQKDMRAWPSNTFDHSPPHRELGLSLSPSHGWLTFEWFSLLLFGVWNELSSKNLNQYSVQPICFINLCSVEISVCFLWKQKSRAKVVSITEEVLCPCTCCLFGSQGTIISRFPGSNH